MNFNEYRMMAAGTDLYEVGKTPAEMLEIEPKVMSAAYICKILGLSGEAGEAAEKYKKVIRDKDGVFDDDDKKEILKELGDVLWYVAAISRYLGVEMETVAKMNVDKLMSRKKREMLHGAGDNR